MQKSGLAIIAVTAAVSGWLVWQSIKPATAPAPDGAQPGAPLATVAVPELTGDALAGARIYDRSCAACHGANAAGQAGIAPPLVHKIYRDRSHADFAFVLAVQNGVRSHHWSFGNMPPVKDVSQKEALSIAAYIRGLQRANGIE